MTSPPLKTCHKKRLSFEVLTETSSTDNKTERISKSAPGHLFGKRNKARNVFYYKDANRTERELQHVTPVKRLNFKYFSDNQTSEETLAVTTFENSHQVGYERKRKAKKPVKPGSIERLDELLLQVNSDSQLYRNYESNPSAIFTHLARHIRMSSETFLVNHLVYTYPTYTLLNCRSVLEDCQHDADNLVLIFLPSEVYRSISPCFRLLWPYFETKNVLQTMQTCRRIIVAAHMIPVRV
ncbi:hypothetical protein Gasu2_20150 [Galdieria sulphuraria]|nr:hypothetical protein Gasu2_20150 [Galdieria sulphuraria]